MKLFGITGCPLEHSLSPLLHNWALRRAGIAGAYLAWPLESGRMAEMVNAARVLRIQGISVTIPHKEAIMPLLDGLSERARAAVDSGRPATHNPLCRAIGAAKRPCQIEAE